MNPSRIALISLIIVYTTSAVGGPPSTPPPPALEACDRALNACIEVVRVQDVAIERLKGNVSTLQGELAKAKAKEPSLPTWAVIAISGLAGFALATAIAK